MALESGVTYIEDLVSTNPVGATDNVDEGDDHVRNIKTAVKGSFPNLGATAVAATAAEINDLPTKTGTETLTNKTLTDMTATVNGETVYGMVILDTPEELVGSTTPTEAWTQVNSATLNTAEAKTAILRVFASTNTGSSTTGASSAGVSLRKGDSSLAETVAAGTKVVHASHDDVSGSAADHSSDMNDAYVNLDSNYDFKYYTTGTNGDAYQFYIFLIGYYV